MQNCEELPSDALLLAISQFNNRNWFECHETLEDLWMGEHGGMRDFYQGILQISVAMHHWKNGNFDGAISLLKGGVVYLINVQPVCRQVDVADFIAAANRVRDALAGLGKNRMPELEPSLIPRLQMVPAVTNKE
jgi:predicted metal-dependent hydrolase